MQNESAEEAFIEALLDDDPEALYERAPCGYLSTTPDGTIIKVNETFLTLTGYTREQLVGQKTFAELLNPGGRIYHETHYAPMLRIEGTAREIALEIVRADGSRLPALVNARLERDPSGVPLVIRTAVFDATDRRRYEHELLQAKRRAEESEARARALARTLQQTLIPPTPPDIPGLDVAAAYRPAGQGEEVGGDFYDVFQIGEGDWAVVLGDVCGKGVEAAVVTALVRDTIRAVVVQQPDPRQALRRLNQVVLAHGTGRFCTVVLARLRLRRGGWTLTMSTGGHPLPIRLPPDQAPAACGEIGPLIGVFDNPTFADWRCRLDPGTSMLLYTDGVTEARRNGALFGDARLLEAAARYAGSAASLTEGVLAEAVDFQDGTPRDDIALVAFRAPYLE